MAKPRKNTARARRSKSRKKIAHVSAIEAAADQHRLGRVAEAEAGYREVLAKDANNPLAMHYLALLCHETGRFDEAVSLLQAALEQTPNDLKLLSNVGIVFRDAGWLDEAEASLRHALRLQGRNPKTYLLLALVLLDQTRPEQAIKCLQQGINLDPGDATSHAVLGRAYRALDELDKARAEWRRALALDPQCGEAIRGFAEAERHQVYNDDIALMERAWTLPDLTRENRIVAGFALGKVFDELGEYEKSFAYTREANALQRANYRSTIALELGQFETFKRVFSRDFVDSLRSVALDSNRPIFVLGMPRSGTSLVEQILASHSEVFGAGEVTYFKVITDAVSEASGEKFPLGIGDVAPDILAESAQVYIDLLAGDSGECPRTTDKFPHNFLRVPLIAALMPHARIILCERNPLDNCLSLYQHHFSLTHAYAMDLTELGQYYRLYHNLMQHWQQLLPGRMYTVNYEEMVESPEIQIPALLEHCGLDFEPACLEFHNTRRTVNTPSSGQVRRPMYKHAAQRWRNFEEQLLPLRKALGALAEAPDK